jgi:hypothetical protein
MALLPFVRMVAVTGALAVDNISARPDIDLLVVAEPGRVWVCRRFLIVLVRLARVFGDDVCPNYVIAQSKLDLEQRDFFTAHELAQMVPMSGEAGLPRYAARESSGRWIIYHAASRHLQGRASQARIGPLRKGAEKLLATSTFNAWERVEMRRLRSKLRPVRRRGGRGYLLFGAV